MPRRRVARKSIARGISGAEYRRRAISVEQRRKPRGIHAESLSVKNISKRKAAPGGAISGDSPDVESARQPRPFRGGGRSRPRRVRDGKRQRLSRRPRHIPAGAERLGEKCRYRLARRFAPRAQEHVPLP